MTEGLALTGLLRRHAITATVATVALLALGAVGPAPDAQAQTAACQREQVRTGIAVVTGCFTREGAIHTARGDQVVDLNGFGVRLTGANARLVVNTTQRRISTPGTRAQIMALRFPVPNDNLVFGETVELNFVVPHHGDFALTSLPFSLTNRLLDTLTSLIPIGRIEVPLTLHEDGTGSFDVGLTLTGFFAYMGRAQSVRIRVRVAPNEGTRFDGFHFSLKKLDALQFLQIENLEATYSRANEDLTASGAVVFGFAEGRGFRGEVEVERGMFRSIVLGATGLRIPIGKAGFLTDIAGGASTNSLRADFSASFGPEVLLNRAVGTRPARRAALVTADAGFELNRNFFRVRGEVSVLDLQLARLAMRIFFSGAFDIDFSVGIGLPSFRNNPRDTFYAGLNVSGWIDGPRYNFVGDGRFSFATIELLQGEGLLSDRGVGACWRVLGIRGGVFFRYSDRRLIDFGIGNCGLSDYSRPRPFGAIVAQTGTRRSFVLGRDDVVVQVRGRGGPPRFVARSSDGRVFRTPAAPDTGVRVDRGGRRNDHAFFLNPDQNWTHLVMPRPAGRWTITALPGSPPITSVEMTKEAPPLNLHAEVKGTGDTRTLVWRSRDLPRAALQFEEELPGGVYEPILRTDKPSGRHRFRPFEGSHYGRRRLRVVVLRGGSPGEIKVYDSYSVAAPPRPGRPRRVSARHDLDDVLVRWGPARHAQHYTVELVSRDRSVRPLRYVQEVGPRRRTARFTNVPTQGERMRVSVHAIGEDDRHGPARSVTVAIDPPARSLAQATRRSVASTRLRRGRVAILVLCPNPVHCQGTLTLRQGGRTLLTRHFEHPPESIHRLSYRLPRRVRGRGAARARLRLVQGRRSVTRRRTLRVPAR